MEFLVDPGEQADGTVGQGVANCLRFRAVHRTVAGAFFLEPKNTVFTALA